VQSNWKFQNDSPKRCHFVALLYLISHLPTKCESTTLPNNSSNTYSNSCYSRLILHIDAMSFMVVSFKPWPLYPRCQLNRPVSGFQFLFTCFWQYKSLLLLFDIELIFLAVAACCPVTVLRLPQLNSSNGRTALIFQILLIAQESSGVAAAATADVLFCSGFLISHLKYKWGNWL